MSEQAEAYVDDAGLVQLAPKLSKKFDSAIACTMRYLVMMGGAGSGKSQHACRKLLLRCINEQNHKFLVLRKVGATIRTSTWALFLDVLNTWLIPYGKNKSDFTITLPFCNSSIIFAGLDDPEKIKSIQGVTGIWMEEATEFSKLDFAEIDRRLRGIFPNYLQIIMTFNPEEATIGGVWLKERFFDNIDPKAFVHLSTVKDNRYIDEGYIDLLANEKDPIQRKIYFLGQFAASKGLIFDALKIVSELPKCDLHLYGLDFGFVDPSVILDIGLHGNELCVKELLHSPGKLTSGIIKTLKDNKVDPMAYIYCDSAEQDRIEEIYQAGFKMVKGAKKDVLTGIDWIKRFTILSLGDNQQTNKDFRGYKWKADRNGELLDEPAHMFSHAPDALRYAVYTYCLEMGLIAADNENRFDMR